MPVSSHRPIPPIILSLLALPWQIAAKWLFRLHAPQHIQATVANDLRWGSLYCLAVSLPGIIALASSLLIVARRRSTLTGIQLALLLFCILLSLSSTASAICDILLTPIGQAR